MGYKGRDVEVVKLSENLCIVTACDSCGAIGSKELDIVKVPPYIVGRYTLRGTLMEVLSAGAYPVTISAAISNELSPTGEGILEGIKDELKFMGVDYVPMAISTEKNMPTCQTGVGITVVGTCETDGLRIGTSKPGDAVYSLGIPKVGNEVSGPEDQEVANGRHVQLLSKIEGVHDILPVGSRGILKEAQSLAEGNRCEFILEPEVDIDVNKSAGPSTCLIFTFSSENEFPGLGSAHIVKVGRLK